MKFTLVFDNVGIKYVNKKDAGHLVNVLKDCYKIEIDWTGRLNCVIILDWNNNDIFIDISKKQLQKYEHIWEGPPQDNPYPAPTNKHGKAAQDSIPEDMTKKLSKDKKKRVQQVVGSILYYTKAINITLLLALSTIDAEQSKATEFNMDMIKQILDYCTMHSNTQKSDMSLNIHLDASYLGVPKAKNHAVEHSFLDVSPKMSNQ